MAWTTRPTYSEWQEPTFPTVLPATLQAGYSVTLPNIAQGQPLLLVDHPPGIPVPPSQLGVFGLGGAPLGVSRNPQIGMFIRDSEISAGSIGELGRAHYIPYATPDGRIGSFVIGKSPIGFRRQVHRTVTLGVPDGRGETEGP
jgi:hypothetical protein